MYGLLDCNSFYASCEKIFRPDLRDRPVVVLSNNDGCVIARTQEAKDLGIPMGEPYFKCRRLLERSNGAVFSANFCLYGDISARVMSCMRKFLGDVEVYSIDEAFFHCPGTPEQVAEGIAELRRTVERWCGVKVSVGAGRSKTLAKVANRLVKKSGRKTGGTLTLAGPADEAAALGQTPVGDVWGIGRAHTKNMSVIGVETALDFIRLDCGRVRKIMGMPGVRTWEELRGWPRIGDGTTPRKSIIHSRSFPKRVTKREWLVRAARQFAACAAAKARSHNLRAGMMGVDVVYGQNRKGERRFDGLSGPIVPASNDSFVLMAAAQRLAERLFRQGDRYIKVGVTLLEMTDKNQGHLFLSEPDNGALMDAVDRLNRSYGRGTVGFGGSRFRQNQQRLSPGYTTCVRDLPVVG